MISIYDDCEPSVDTHEEVFKMHKEKNLWVIEDVEEFNRKIGDMSIVYE